MKMNELLQDDDAVSPVIGVILMVSITVILAAVIGTFVLGLGDQLSATAPSASFSFDEAVGNSDNVEISHDGGESIPAAQLIVNCGGDTGTGTWSGDPVTAGHTYTCTMGAGDKIKVIWESEDGSTSQVLAEYDTS